MTSREFRGHSAITGRGQEADRAVFGIPARYDGPLTSWFLRRNEIIVPDLWPADGVFEDVAPRPRARL